MDFNYYGNSTGGMDDGTLDLDQDEGNYPVSINPVIGDDGSTVVGWVAVNHYGETVTSEHPTKQGAIDEALASGFDPFMTDAEIDEENEALDHGDYLPF